MDHGLTRQIKESVPLLATLAVTALVLGLCALLYLGREIFVPVALAVLLSFVLAPAVRILQRLRLPHGLAVVVVVLVAFSTIGLMAFVVASQLSDLIGQVPGYRSTISQKLDRLGGSVGSNGALKRAVEAVEELSTQISGMNKGEAKPAADGSLAIGTAARPVPVTIQDGGGMLSMAGGVVSPLLHPLATSGLVLIFAVFVLAQREDLRNRLIRLIGTDDLQHTTAVFDDAGRRLSRFFLTQLALNCLFGILIGIGLSLIGVPSPVLWGILGAVLRFVPYVGAILSAAVPLALSVAVDPGWSMLIWTALLFVVLEPLFGHVLEPLLYGHSTGLSPVAIILAATVWAFLWGPIGLVLATPLTVCLVVLGRHIGQLEFLDIMLGDRPALSPAEIFYQRMLAGDPTEATIQAREFLRERALATYYDEVALEGVRLAHRDIARGRISPDRQAVLRRSIAELIRNLESITDPFPFGGAVGSEAAAAVVAAGPDRAGATIMARPEDLRPDWRGEVPILCIAARDTVDDVIAAMLVQVLTKQGLRARLVHTDEVASLAEVGRSGVRLAILSYVEPLSTLHLRYAVRQARRGLPGIKVVLGIWSERDPAMGLSLRRTARADILATTVYGTLSAVQEAAGIAAPPRPTPVLRPSRLAPEPA